MSTLPFGISISGHGFSSALALQTSSIAQCPPTAFEANASVVELDSEDAFVTGRIGIWGHKTQDAQFFGSVTVTGDAAGQPARETMFLLMAYSLLRVMPPEGLEETYQSLKDIFEFHSEISRKALPAPSGRRLRVKLRQSIVQSGFRIEEE